MIFLIVIGVAMIYLSGCCYTQCFIDGKCYSWCKREERAIKLCKKHGGMEEYYFAYAKCKDGTEFKDEVEK